MPWATRSAWRDLLTNGPVVVTFYRGEWCPYCNLQLRALQEALPEITSTGATLVAISPQAGPRPDDDRKERLGVSGSE